MTGTLRTSALVAACLATALAAAPAVASTGFTPSQFVVFGDSFVDAGVVNQVTGGAFAPRELGFWQGRFSDGPTWVDYLGFANFGTTTRRFTIGADTLPPPYTLGATNFAIGGARASGDVVQVEGVIPGLLTQTFFYSQYLAQTGQGVDPDALYILNFGNNDVTLIEQIRDDPALTPAEKADLIGQVQTAYVTNMTNVALGLAFNGADHILIGGVPNPLEAEGVFLQSLLSASLAAAAPTFSALGATLSVFDYFGFFLALQADPTQFGLPATMDFNTPCLLAEVPSPTINCSNYLSFDGIHVTTGVQRAISIQIANQLGIAAVPEPATWGMMILGFGAVGFALRRRARADARAA